MPIIPRYQPRGGPRTEALTYAGAYAPPDGSDWRMLGRAAEAAGSVVQLAQGLFANRPEEEDEGEPGADKSRHGPPGAQTRRSSMTKAPAALEATEKEVAWREGQAREFGPQTDPEEVPRVRQQIANTMPGASGMLFDLVTRPREGGFVAEAAARTHKTWADRWEALAIRREQLGVEEYVRQAEIDEGLGRLALASAVAQRGERLAAAGYGPEAVKAGKHALLVEAQVSRISRAASHDPVHAAGLLASLGGSLPEPTRRALGDRIAAQKDRLEADQRMTELAQAGLGLEDMMREVEGLAGPDPERVELFRGAAIGAWAQARRDQEARDDAAWSAVAGQLAPDSPVTGWTQLHPDVWDALSDTQKGVVRNHFEAPWRESDSAVEMALKTAAAQAPEQFRGIDLGVVAGQLTAARYGYWRGLQRVARQDGPEWRTQQARFGQDVRVVDRVVGRLGLAGEEAEAARVAGDQGMQEARLLAGGPLSEADLEAACQKGVLDRVLSIFPPFRQKMEREEDEAADRELARQEKLAKEALDRVLRPAYAKSRIDWEYIRRWENGLDPTTKRPKTPLTQGYVPSSGSGVTIGTGVDIGQRDLAEFKTWDIEPALFQKLAPYLDKTGAKARAALKKRSLTLTAEEAEQISRASQKHELGRLVSNFNRDSKIGPFHKLPVGAQTVLLSLYMHHGASDPAKDTPRLWGHVTTGDWAAAVQEIKTGFPSDLPKDRRPADAARLQQDIDAGLLKVKAKPATAAPKPAPKASPGVKPVSPGSKRKNAP